MLGFKPSSGSGGGFFADLLTDNPDTAPSHDPVLLSGRYSGSSCGLTSFISIRYPLSVSLRLFLFIEVPQLSTVS